MLCFLQAELKKLKEKLKISYAKNGGRDFSLLPSRYRHSKRAGTPPAQYIKPYQDKKSSIHK